MFEVMKGLEAVKVELCDQIDREAGAVRGKYITTVPGQEMIYMQKRLEAETLTAVPTTPEADTPHITSEAAAQGVTREAKAAEILAIANAWAGISPQIETTRLLAKQAVNNATTVAEARAAAEVDWPA